MLRITRQIDKEENRQFQNRNHNYPTIFDTCRNKWLNKYWNEPILVKL